MRIERSHRNRNPRRQAHLRSPPLAQVSRNRIGAAVLPTQLLPNPIEQRIELRQKRLRRQSTPARIPHPLMPHRADTARHQRRIRNSDQRSRHHVAVLQRRSKPLALLRIVPQPIQQLRKSPLMRVHAAAPLNRFQPRRMRQLCNLLRFLMRPMITPQHIFVQRLQLRIHRDHARSSRIQGQCDHILRRHPRLLHHVPHRLHQCAHLVLVRLRRKIRIFPPPMQRIPRRRCTQPPLHTIQKRDSNTQSSKVHASHDCHTFPLLHP